MTFCCPSKIKAFYRAGDSTRPDQASSTASTPPVTITTTVRVTDPGSTATTTIAVPVQQPPRVETVTVTLAPPAPAAAISEGVWTVGVDIAPGVCQRDR